jgi:hypothetical protein
MMAATRPSPNRTTNPSTIILRQTDRADLM